MSFIQTLRFARCISSLLPVPRWKAEKVQRLREKRLRRLVALAIQRSPFYREKYREIDPQRFTLAHLPPCSKPELMAHFDDMVTDRAVRRADVEHFVDDPENLGRWYLGRYAVSHTSGSQGQPMLIVQDRKSLEIFYALMCSRATQPARRGFSRGFPASFGRCESPSSPCAAEPTLRALRSNSCPSWWEASCGSSGSRRFKAISIDELNAFQPNVIVSYASVLEALSLRAAELKLAGLRQLANISEELTPAGPDPGRAGLRRSPAGSLCGGRVSPSGQRLPGRGRHINSDWAIFEVVDDDYRPVPPGQLGRKVLVTNLASDVQPFIRYEVGDRVVRGGRALPLRKPLAADRPDRRPGGRDLLDSRWSRHRMVHAALFHSVLDALGDIAGRRASPSGTAWTSASNSCPAARSRSNRGGRPLTPCFASTACPTRWRWASRSCPTLPPTR